MLQGKTEVYKSSQDANNLENGVDSNTVYMPSWKTATPGNYYAEENGTMKKIDNDTANDYYRNGQNLTQSVVNGEDIIGYVNIENNDTKKGIGM